MRASLFPHRILLFQFSFLLTLLHFYLIPFHRLASHPHFSLSSHGVQNSPFPYPFSLPRKSLLSSTCQALTSGSPALYLVFSFLFNLPYLITFPLRLHYFPFLLLLLLFIFFTSFSLLFYRALILFIFLFFSFSSSDVHADSEFRLYSFFPFFQFFSFLFPFTYFIIYFSWPFYKIRFLIQLISSRRLPVTSLALPSCNS